MWKIMFITVFLLGELSQAATITVAPEGANFTSIQNAVNAANSGDVINILAGVYLENIVIDKPIALLGVGDPIVDAGGLLGNGPAFTLFSDGVLIEGLIAVNSSGFGGDFNGAAIDIYSSNNIISKNIIRDGIGIGLIISNCSNNTIVGNQVLQSFAGIILRNSDFNSITDNNFSRNRENGMLLDKSRNNTVMNNQFSHNQGSGILLQSSYNNILDFNTAGNNMARGLGIYSSNGNKIRQNNFINNSGGSVFDDGSNSWGDPSDIGMGNYYSDFICTDSDDNRVCDLPNIIPGGSNMDKFPQRESMQVLFCVVGSDILSNWQSYLNDSQSLDGNRSRSSLIGL